MELKYVFLILFRKKWIIICCTLLAVIIAFLLTRNKQRVFKSVAQISTGYTVSENMKLSDDNFNISQIDVKFSNAIENITSPKVLSLLSYSLILHDLTVKEPFRRLGPEKAKGLPDIDLSDKPQIIQTINNKRDSLQLLSTTDPFERKLLRYLELFKYDIESLKGSLYVARYQRTDYINIVAYTENPNLSAFVVNTLIANFQRYFESFRRERSNESIASLDSLVRKRKDELDGLIGIKSQFLTDSSVLDPNIESSNLMQRNQFETLLAETRGISQNLSYQIDQLDDQIKILEAGGVKTNPSHKTNNNDEYMILRKQYNDLYSEYVRKGANDQDLKNKLDDLKSRMQTSIASSTSVSPTQEGTSPAVQLENLRDRRIILAGELKSANIKIGYYQSRLGQLKGSIGQSSKSGSLQQLEKDIEIATAEYTSVKDKLNMAYNMVEGVGNNFKQTMFGQPSTKPEPSKRLMIIALSGATTFLLSSIVFIFLTYIDQSIKAPSQFSRQTGLKLLGITNKIPLKTKKISEHIIIESEAESKSRKNSFRELLRKIRYEVESSGKRVILFTSTEAQQGKTTLSQALAYSLSLNKKKVLLLDTNFCNNDITAYNDADPVLEDFSGNGHAVEFEDISHLISKTDVENIHIIGCKGGDYTPNEILPKNHLLNYLTDLLKIYDYIFMEGAPLNGYTDSRELVQYADGVIAIFSAHSEIKQGDKESLAFLRSLNDKFLGGVLNMVEMQDVKM